MDALDLKYSKAILLKILENGGKVKKTDLLSLIKNYQTLSKVVDFLIEDGYLKPIVKKGRGKTIILELTEKGRFIAEQLEKVYNLPKKPINISKDEFDKMAKDWKRLSFKPKNTFVLQNQLFSLIIRPSDSDRSIYFIESNFDGQGHDRTVKISILMDEDSIVRLYCDVDQSTTCWHVQYAWTLPKVQAWVQKYLKLHIEQLQGNEKSNDTLRKNINSTDNQNEENKR